MAINTPAALQALQIAFKKHFQDGLALAPSQYKDIAAIVPTTTKFTAYGWLGAFPSMQEWIGDRTFKNMQASNYQIEVKPYQSAVSVKRTDLADDQLGIYAPLFREEGLAAGRHPDQLTFKVLQEAADASGAGGLCYDGKTFFHEKHPVFPNVDGTGTAIEIANNYKETGVGAKQGPAWYLLDCSRAIKPLIFQEREKVKITHMVKDDDESVFMRDEYRFGISARYNVGFGLWQLAARSTKALNAANFEEAYTNMRKLKGDGLIPLDVRPTHILVPPQLYGKAMDLVGVQRNASGADNAYYNRVKIIESAWLD